MKSCFLIIFSLFFSFSVHAQLISYDSTSHIYQDSTLKLSKYLFKANHLSFSLTNGINRYKIIPAYGNHQPLSPLGHIHRFDMAYTYQLGDQIGFTLNAGVGIFPFVIKVNSYGPYIGTEWNSYFTFVQYDPFIRLEGSLNYRRVLSEKHLIQAWAGPGVLSIHPFEKSFESSGPGNQSNFLFLTESDGGYFPFLNLQLGISRILKNKDILTLKIGYDHFFRDIFTGNYYIYDSSSWGSIINTGNNFHLGISYTLSKAEKQKRISEIVNSGSQQKGNAEIIYKKEKRLIDPKSMFISLSAGLSSALNHANDKNDVMQNGSIPIFTSLFSIEKGIDNNYFAEAGFALQEYFEVEKFKEENFTSGTNAFYSYQISLGGGKRLISKANNYNYLNLHAGLTFVLTDQKPGISGWGVTSIITVNNDTILYSESISYQVRQYFPLVYAGVSKDLRITSRLYFTLLYRYYQGIFRVYEQKVNYISQWTTGWQEAKITMNGSYHTFQIGLKYNMGDINWKLSKPIDRKATNIGFLVFSPAVGWNKIDYYNYSEPQMRSEGTWRMAVINPGLGYEHHLRNNWLVESRVSYRKLHIHFMKMDMLGFDIGLGKMFYLKNNRNLLNLHTGFSLGGITKIAENDWLSNYAEEYQSGYINSINYDPATSGGTVTGLRITKGDTTFFSHSEFKIGKRVNPLLYFGFSKDFRINEKIYLTGFYRQHIGFNEIFKVHTQEHWEADEGPAVFFEGESSKNCSGMIGFAIKYRLVSKKSD